MAISSPCAIVAAPGDHTSATDRSDPLMHPGVHALYPVVDCLAGRLATSRVREETSGDLLQVYPERPYLAKFCVRVDGPAPMWRRSADFPGGCAAPAVGVAPDRWWPRTYGIARGLLPT